MNRPVARYRSSRRYLLFSLIALAGAGVSLWAGMRWSPAGWNAVAFAASGAFALTAAAILVLFARPMIEVYETHLQIGRRAIAWNHIHRLDQTGWVAPLALRITLDSGDEILLLYPGDLDSCTSLDRYLRRYSRHALLDGVPYRQFWGENAPPTSTKEIAPTRYPVLRPEDEQEVERMFQRLKSAGRIDEHAPDEKIGEK